MRNIYRFNATKALREAAKRPITTNDGYPVYVYLFIDRETTEQLAYLEYNPYKNGMLYLRQLTVENFCQKEGIGQYIIESFLKELKEFNSPIYDRVELEADNHSEGFWFKCGFTFMNKMTSGRPRMVYKLR